MLEATFTPVTGGNRRAIKRKMARMLGESPPRMRAKNRYLATTTSAYVLPEPYRPAKRAPREQDGPVTTTNAVLPLTRCQECSGPFCEPRLHDVGRVRLIRTRETFDRPETLS